MNLDNHIRRGLIGCACALALFGTAAPAQSATKSIRGFVSIQGSKIFLLPMTPPALRPGAGLALALKPLPIETSIANRTALMDLKTGDFVVLSGAYQDTDGDRIIDQVNVAAIESVGLNAVLGTWRNAKWELVRFEDFNRVSLYRPRFVTNAKTGEHDGPSPVTSLQDYAKLKDLNYTLAPERGSAYSIFLVEKTQKKGPAPVYVGRLRLPQPGVGGTLTIEILDPRTGTSSEVLSLSPVQD